jgi:predicted nucleic acid-binding Zn ribbon protein
MTDAPVKRCAYCGCEVPGPERICSPEHREYLSRIRRMDLAQLEHFATERRKAMQTEVKE